MKVLIADSDWHFARQARGFLESRAHYVVCESHPREALGRAGKWLPDLVILAAEFAVKDGFVSSLSALDPAPAVLLTERMDRFDRAWRAWQIGGDELLIKPVLHTHELHSAIVAARENAVAGVRRQVTPAAIPA